MSSHSEAPEWVYLGRNLYQNESGKKPDPILYTNITRGQTAVEVIERDIAPSWSKTQEFSVCIVGPGIDGSSAIHQAYEPYVIAARLESLEIPYQMTIIDRNPRSLVDIQKRRTIFYYNNQSFSSTENMVYWRRFLEDTRQKDQITHEQIPELEFREEVLHRGQRNALLTTIPEYLCNGFHFAQIPDSFAFRLSLNQINLINDDIVTLDPSIIKLYDLITCTNVITYMVYPETQLVTLWNMTRMLKKGGLIILNDFEDNSTKSILASRGGWLTDDILHDLSLTMMVVYQDKRHYYQDLLFTKV